MVNQKVVQEWIEKAESDFKFAEYSLENTEYFTHVCFHFQQSAEKYIKAFIVSKELPLEKIHNLMDLLVICKNGGYSFDRLADAASLLDSCYIDTRYPVHWPSNYSKAKATQAFEAAKQIRDTVLASL